MKIKLHAIGNQDNFNYYIFDKKQDVAEKIAALLGIKTLGINWYFYEEYEDKKGKWVNKKINVEKYKDHHESIRSGNKRMDVFYGDKEMFIAIHCLQTARLKFNEELFKIALMPNPKKSNKFVKRMPEPKK